MARGKFNLFGLNVRCLVLLMSIMAISISCCQAGAETEHKGKFLYCGPASPVMIDWLCRSIDHLQKHGIMEGYIDPEKGYLPLSAPSPYKKRSADTTDLANYDILDDLPDERTLMKRGIHAHVAMSLCCRRMCDARVFCRGYL